MARERILVSACLLGIGCRYDGASKPNTKVIELKDRYELIPICPEIYGGLPTPRIPSEIVGDRVVMKDGADVTEQYRRGAREAVRLCQLFDIRIAVLKARSPSCGTGKIYDGSFGGVLIDGDGITSEALKEIGIKVISEEELYTLCTE